MPPDWTQLLVDVRLSCTISPGDAMNGRKGRCLLLEGVPGSVGTELAKEARELSTFRCRSRRVGVFWGAAGWLQIEATKTDGKESRIMRRAWVEVNGRRRVSRKMGGRKCFVRDG